MQDGDGAVVSDAATVAAGDRGRRCGWPAAAWPPRVEEVRASERASSRSSRPATSSSRSCSKLEDGQTSLDEALELWERGEQLHALCQAKLDQAEQRVAELLERMGRPVQDPPAGG